MRGKLIAITLIGLTITLQGCAETADPAPSYLGFAPTLAGDAADAAVAPAKPSKAARHMSSNKVLGAMAFQKTTGRTVDPGRLSENR